MPEREFLTNIVDYIVGAEGEKVTSDEIRDVFGITETVTGNFNTRRFIKEAMRTVALERGIPIGAGNNGYFVIEDLDALRRYVENLHRRIEGIYEKIQLVRQAWSVHRSNPSTD